MSYDYCVARMDPSAWMDLAFILNDQETGQQVCRWFPEVELKPEVYAKALLAVCTVLVTPEADCVVIFEPNPLGHVIHILALPTARHGKALAVLEDAIAWAFVEAEWYRLLAMAPEGHAAALKLGLKAGMRFLHQANGWEMHSLDYLTWVTNSPLLQRLGEGTPDPIFGGLRKLVSTNHPLLSVAEEIVGGFGAVSLSKEV